jgi:hypothetical protein
MDISFGDWRLRERSAVLTQVGQVQSLILGVDESRGVAGVRAMMTAWQWQLPVYFALGALASVVGSLEDWEGGV